MSNTSVVVTIILVLALLLRVALDIASIKSPKPIFDIAYAILFALTGMILLITDARNGWGYASLGIACWSLLSFFFTKYMRK